LRALDRARRARRGFTLAEVAVTIVIVGTAVLLVIQGLNNSKMTAAHSRNYKLARELALLTFSRIEAGLFEEDIEDTAPQSFANEGYPDFYFELRLGDETFESDDDDPDDRRFDSWRSQDERDEEDRDEDDETAEEWESVKVRVSFPQILEYTNELVLERWIPWELVYRKKDRDDEGEGEGSQSGASSSGDSGAGAQQGGGR
jgi:prepilin-type N-terminal cleavage/methylation domain-containing protein